MQHGSVVRGRLRGRVIELDQPVDHVEDGQVEVQIRSVRGATPRSSDVLDVIATLPAGHRTKADIDQQLADERSGWTDGS
jgi:hypothetical protein